MPWKQTLAVRAKQFLNARANAGLSRLGYSEPMIRDVKREAWWWLQARAAAVAQGRSLIRGWGVVWASSGRAELLPVDVPTAASDEVTVAVMASAISPGTERARYLQLPNARVGFPHRPGYSLAGRVIAAGRKVSHVRVGDIVAVSGAPHASVATVPAANVYKVPDGVAPEDAAFIELGIISGYGVRVAAPVPGEALCVLGCGLIGCLAQRIAVGAGAGETTMIARTRARERLALDGGAVRFVALQDGAHLVEEIGAPVVIEATGDPRAVITAMQAARPGGRVVILGSPRGVTHDVALGDLVSRRLTLAGAHVNGLTHEARLSGGNPRRDLGESFLALLASGRLSLAGLVTATIDPREADAFYRDLARDPALVGARFDWTVLPEDQRAAPGRLWSLPDLSGRGMEQGRKPMTGTPVRRASGAADREPFAGASGRLRIGLVGCGDIAVHNAAGIAAAPNATLVACFDPVRALADDLANRFGGEAMAAAGALFERRDLDAVVLSVPHHLHAPLALEAIAAGKHVIVEKPLANNLAAASAMVAAAERAGVRLSVCFPHRYQANVAAARDLVRQGALGAVAGTYVSFFADKPPSYWLGGFSGRSMSTWRSSREQAGGGVLIMNLSHYLDLVRHIAGIEAAACAAATGLVDPPAEVEDTISLTLRYRNGAVGNLLACSSSRGHRSTLIELRIWGADGHIAVEPEPRLYTLRALDGIRPARWHSFGESEPRDIRAIYFSRIATAIDQGLEPDVTAADGLAIQALMEAAYRSSDRGEAVQVETLARELVS